MVLYLNSEVKIIVLIVVVISFQFKQCNKSLLEQLKQNVINFVTEKKLHTRYSRECLNFKTLTEITFNYRENIEVIY